MGSEEIAQLVNCKRVDLSWTPNTRVKFRMW